VRARVSVKASPGAGRYNPILATVPLLLTGFGIAIPLAGGGFTTWQLAIVWCVVVIGVALAIRVFRPTRQMRVILGVAALVMLFLLGFEGGWWLMPAVAAQMVVDARAARSIEQTA
jgi:hypothetical protein